jgi:hypothetical protein
MEHLQYIVLRSKLLPLSAGTVNYLKYSPTRAAAAVRAPRSPARQANRARTPLSGYVSLGPGQPGQRLYLFLATWDQEITTLAGQLDALNAYARLTQCLERQAAKGRTER